MSIKVKNVRNTATKISLLHAFIQLMNEKPFEKISIYDITSLAQVNRSTFYAHFDDKYELFKYMIGDSATSVIEHHTNNFARLDHECIYQLVVAVCEYYIQPQEQCKRDHLIFNAMLQQHMLDALQSFLQQKLTDVYSLDEQQFYVPLYANMIHEAAYLAVNGQIQYDHQNIADRLTRLILPHVSESIEHETR